MNRLKDPNYLCELALALHHVKAELELYRNTAEHHDTVPKSTTAAFDALAQLIVDQAEPTDRFIALGVVLSSHGHTEIYAAGDTELPPKAIAHLHDVCAQLVSIRAIVNTHPRLVVVLETISLEHLLYEYSAPCLRDRLEKAGWWIQQI
ncbi:hypothetical protein C8Q79DRAFT_1013767 [Trametes meyenii]|nr:hypothetical protein C8Q79DRAFT_1013767 [Trametes meyenii]